MVGGRQITLHNVNKNANIIIIYSLNPARENNTFSETPNRERAQLPGHSSLLAKLQSTMLSGLPEHSSLGSLQAKAFPLAERGHKACPDGSSRTLQGALGVNPAGLSSCVTLSKSVSLPGPCFIFSPLEKIISGQT